MNKFIKRVWAKMRGEPETVEFDENLVPVKVPPLRKHREAVNELVAQAVEDKHVAVIQPEPPKPPGVKCSLPGCSILTLHNGGYCCADHCRDDRQRLRAQKSA